MQECKNLKGILLKLKYLQKLIDAVINRVHHPPDLFHTPPYSLMQIIIPCEDQRSADVVRKQLRNLERKNDLDLQRIFTSKKIVDDSRVTERKSPLVNQQSVVYEFRCDLCDTNYIGYTRRHLHQRVEKPKYSVIGPPNPSSAIMRHHIMYFSHFYFCIDTYINFFTFHI